MSGLLSACVRLFDGEAVMSNEAYEREGEVYDLSTQNLASKVTEMDRLIATAIHKNKQHLGTLGMIECALVVARELARRI